MNVSRRKWLAQTFEPSSQDVVCIYIDNWERGLVLTSKIVNVDIGNIYLQVQCESYTKENNHNVLGYKRQKKENFL